MEGLNIYRSGLPTDIDIKQYYSIDKKFLFMLRLTIIALLFIQCGNLFSQTTIFQRWHKTDLLIRDRKIDKDDAIDSIGYFVTQAVKEFKSSGLEPTKKDSWVYPLTGWTKVSYRTGGLDYKDERFDYFQGGEYKGHPAHDIFIPDKDSNGIEDSTGEKVTAVSMVNGVVISLYDDWQAGDFLRSGNYIKIFDPQTEAIFYYSHLDTVLVNVGDYVRAGGPVAIVGRTGRKAIHGKTHLHIAYYKIVEGYPRPVDIIKELYALQKK